MRSLLALLLVVPVACDRSAPTAVDKSPVIPDGFNEKTLDSLRCPENLSALRFATRKEIDDANQRIGAGKLKRWSGEPQTELVKALLIRADGKIAYHLDGVIPDLRIEEALVLDERVGHPDPAKHRK